MLLYRYLRNQKESKYAYLCFFLILRRKDIKHILITNNNMETFCFSFFLLSVIMMQEAVLKHLPTKNRNGLHTMNRRI